VARNHARILTSIWSSDFVERSPRAQWLYLVLLSQPDLTPCGALAYVPGRWARLSPTMKIEDVEKAATELEEHRYVVIDHDTAELVIRTLVVHDGGLANSKMRGAVKSSLGALHSERLKRAVIEVIPIEHRTAIDLGSSIGCRSDSIPDPETEPRIVDPKVTEVGGRRQETSQGLPDLATPPGEHGSKRARAPADSRIAVLVSGYVEDYRAERPGKDPPRGWRNACGGAVKRALCDGEEPEDIAACLGVIAHESKNPSTLQNVLADKHAGRERRAK